MTLVNSTPRFTTQQAQEIAQSHFDFIATATMLPGERDQNFHLKTQDGQAFVLKIANPQEDRAALVFQNQIMAHLNANGVTSPRAVRPIKPVTGDNGETYLIRLLTFLPGKPLGKFTPHAGTLLVELGQYLAEMDNVLQQFTGDQAVNHDFHWDLANAVEVISQNLSVHDTEDQQTIQHFLDIYQEVTAPLLHRLESGLIHNDANDYNIILDESGKLSGIIDFGDMVESYIVGELAIACAYVMLKKADPLAAATHVVRGYNTTRPLTEADLKALFGLICMRLCVSVTMAAVQRSQQPNNSYLSISEQDAWSLLKTLKSIHPCYADYAFRDACGVEPVPHHPAITQWLNQNTETFSPILESDRFTVLDLSVGSTLFPDLQTITNVEAFTQEVNQVCNGTIGVGRYDEARLIYTSDLFSQETNSGTIQRTIHLGIDLFVPADTPVHAPLAGTVHSFANNNKALDYGPTIIVKHEIPSGEKFFTLYGHLSLESLDDIEVGQIVNAGDVIGTLGDHSVNGGWPPHLHFQIVMDMLGQQGEFPGVAAAHERSIWLSLSPDPNVIVGIPHEAFPLQPLTMDHILEKRSQHIGKSLSVSYRKPLHIVRGYAQHLYDVDGLAYLDCVNNVAHVGHGHPRVVKAAQQQIALLNTNTRYLHENLVTYAERLCATLPDELSVCFFVCSGSEANDLALRLARAHTNAIDTIVLDVAYHGNLSSLIEISPYKFNGKGGSGKPDHVHICPMPDTFRGPYRGKDVGEQYAEHVHQVLTEIHQHGGKSANFIAESLLGCGGQIVLPDGFLAKAYHDVRQAGGVCIADEVQVGFGRVGTHFWGFETQGVVPDIVTMGKPIGNGHPLAAVVTTPEIAKSFANGMEYFNTFGGNPVSCAVGQAVLDVIETQQLQANAQTVGTYLLERLLELMTRHAIIGDVRGSGLFIGVELVRNRDTLEPADEEATIIIERMRDHRILLSTDGPLHNVLKIKPPIIFTKTDADLLVNTLDRVLAEDNIKRQLH